ncbi:MAG: YdeI/OmpD-associated family protein [Bacteroidota bacterium]
MTNQNKSYTEEQIIKQLEKRRGGYFYLKISAEVVDQFPNKRKTRFLCTLDDQLTYQCGLNHMGDGNFFIIVSSKNLKSIGKGLGENISFELQEDPNPLGVEMPEVLEVLLAQDEELNTKFEKLSMGNKRHVIHSIIKIKDIDLQISKAEETILLHSIPRSNRSKK